MSEEKTTYVPITNENTLQLQPDVKAEIDMGGMTIFVVRRFSWFHRKMMGLFFGWKVTNK